MLSAQAHNYTVLSKSFEKEYQEATLLFCTRREDEAIAAWWRLSSEEKASKETKAKVTFSLAQAYSTGTGVEQDFEQALGLFKSAARYGHQDAVIEMGRCLRYHMLGHDNASSYASIAVKHFTEAAQKGNIEAQYELGLCYLKVS